RMMYAEPFLLRIQDLKWGLDQVVGYRLGPGGWHRWFYPFPDVVYDQAPGRWNTEGKGQLFSRLQRRGIPVFNGAIGYKWSIHRRLAARPDLRPHLPETQLALTPHAVLALLAR